jgi:hypothetical protein
MFMSCVQVQVQHLLIVKHITIIQIFICGFLFIDYSKKDTEFRLQNMLNSAEAKIPYSAKCQKITSVNILFGI